MRSCRSSGWAAWCWASSSGRRAARRSRCSWRSASVSLAAFAWWLVRRKREGKPTLIDPDLFKSALFRFGISGQLLQNVALGGAMITIPIYLQMVLEYNALQAGLSLAPLSLSMFGAAILAGRRSGNRRPASIIRAGFALLLVGLLSLIPIIPRADAGWYLAIPLVIAGIGLGLLVSQLNNYTLSPIVEERVSEAAGVNSAAGSFGLSFGLAFAGAIMLATLAFSFTNLAEQSAVLTPAQQQEVAAALEHDAEVMTNTALDALIVNQPPEVEAEIIRINTEARPFALQVALLIPIIASLLGLLTSFRMIAPAGSGVRGDRRARPGLTPRPPRPIPPRPRPPRGPPPRRRGPRESRPGTRAWPRSAGRPRPGRGCRPPPCRRPAPR